MATGIEWTDETWNPMTGCTQISSGCDHCYAKTVAETKTREVYLRQLPVKDSAENRDNPFAPRFWPDRLMRPFGWRTPKRVFVNSMSDVFHAHFSLEQIQMVFDVMRCRNTNSRYLLSGPSELSASPVSSSGPRISGSGLQSRI
jgi:protein gp37